MPQLDISATALRRRVTASQSIRYLVPDAVCDYIAEHGIYACVSSGKVRRRRVNGEDQYVMKYADLGMFDRVRLRKPHPCGSSDWRVVRLGADIGLKCEGCGRRVLLSRSEVEQRIKLILSRGADEFPIASDVHNG